MGVKVGHKCKVEIGGTACTGMGTWSLSGITSDQMEASDFGDTWKTYEFGMKDGGQITFNGLLDPDSVQQNLLQKYNLDNTDVTYLRLFVDNTSFYEPCQTAGYFNNTSSSGEDTVASHVNITSYDISVDKSGLAQVSFTAKVSGIMVLC